MNEGRSRRLAHEFREKIRTGAWAAGKRVPTTRELAASYGVSVNTVQNAFKELEASNLVERVPRLGGFVKRGVPTLSSVANTIAVVGAYMDLRAAGAPVDDMSWENRITRGCDAELAESGFHVSLFSCDPTDADAAAKVLAKVDQVGPTLGGVMFFVYPTLASLPAELDRRNIAWVTVNRPTERAMHNFVSQDAVGGVRLVARCLARMPGVRQVALVLDRFGPGRSTQDKYTGFMRGWADAGRPSRQVDLLQCDGFSDQVAYDRMRAHLAEYGRPDAVFASGDLQALGVVRALREAGAEVGRDAHVIASTGLAVAAHTHPSLTVLQTPMEEMGREAARMLLEMAREGVRRMLGRFVQADTVIVRESCPIPREILEEETRLIREGP